MSQMSEMVRKMVALGAAPEVVAIAVEAMENAGRSTAAIRQARYRARKREGGVTRVTTSVTPSVTPEVVKKISGIKPLEELSVTRVVTSVTAPSLPLPPIEEDNLTLFPLLPLPPKGPPTPTKETVEADFADWWAHYPKRDGSNPRKMALKSYIAARKRGVTKAQLLAGLIHLTAQVRGKDAQFVPQAATYLNQDRWGDAEEAGSQDAGPGANVPPGLWATIVDRYQTGRGSWPPWAGPKPGEPDCWAPKELLSVAQPSHIQGVASL